MMHRSKPTDPVEVMARAIKMRVACWPDCQDEGLRYCLCHEFAAQAALSTLAAAGFKVLPPHTVVSDDDAFRLGKAMVETGLVPQYAETRDKATERDIGLAAIKALALLYAAPGV